MKLLLLLFHLVVAMVQFECDRVIHSQRTMMLFVNDPLQC